MNSDFVLARHRWVVQIASCSSETELDLGWREGPGRLEFPDLYSIIDPLTQLLAL